MTPDHPIPRAEHNNVLHMLWVNTTSLESLVDTRDQGLHALDRNSVTAAYNVLNRIGYTTARPAWEERAKLNAKTS